MGLDPILILLVVAFVVGTLIGAVGIGGILLIPALAVFGRLGIHEAMATALFSFAFTGLVGTFLFQRKGSIDWRITIPICGGALLLGFFGAWLNSRTQPMGLSLLLAAVIIFAGIYTLVSRPAHTRPALADNPRAQRALLAGVGVVAGLGSGWTGVGGPAISVPLMVLLGFPTLVSIGASQAIQIVAALSGTLGNLTYGSIDFALAVPVTAIEVTGVYCGAAAAHAVNQLALRRFVAVLCIAVGLFLVGRTLQWQLG